MSLFNRHPDAVMTALEIERFFKAGYTKDWNLAEWIDVQILKPGSVVSAHFTDALACTAPNPLFWIAMIDESSNPSNLVTLVAFWEDENLIGDILMACPLYLQTRAEPVRQPIADNVLKATLGLMTRYLSAFQGAVYRQDERKGHVIAYTTLELLHGSDTPWCEEDVGADDYTQTRASFRHLASLKVSGLLDQETLHNAMRSIGVDPETNVEENRVCRKFFFKYLAARFLQDGFKRGHLPLGIRERLNLVWDAIYSPLTSTHPHLREEMINREISLSKLARRKFQDQPPSLAFDFLGRIDLVYPNCEELGQSVIDHLLSQEGEPCSNNSMAMYLAKCFGVQLASPQAFSRFFVTRAMIEAQSPVFDDAHVTFLKALAHPLSNSVVGKLFFFSAWKLTARQDRLWVAKRVVAQHLKTLQHHEMLMAGLESSKDGKNALSSMLTSEEFEQLIIDLAWDQDPEFSGQKRAAFSELIKEKAFLSASIMEAIPSSLLDLVLEQDMGL